MSADPLDTKRAAAIAWLGERWLLHEANRVRPADPGESTIDRGRRRLAEFYQRQARGVPSLAEQRRIRAQRLRDGSDRG